MTSSAQHHIAGSSPAPPPLRRGWLRHGNRPGDYANAPRCGARTRCGGCCRQPAMRNGRCRMHGGLSTGPRTAAGLARARRARWKHGFCSMEIRVLRGAAAHTARNLDALVRVSRTIVQRRTARSSLGMGSIERNDLSAGLSSGGNSKAEPCPLPALPRANARRRVVDLRDEHWCVLAADIKSQPSSAQRGRAGRGHGTDGLDNCLCAFKNALSRTSSLGMGSIERNPPSVGSCSGGTTPSPTPAPLSGSGSCAG